MRSLQTPPVNAFHPRVFLEQDPFQSPNRRDLKPPSILSSSKDIFPLLSPFISVRVEPAGSGGRGASLPAWTGALWLERSGCGLREALCFPVVLPGGGCPDAVLVGRSLPRRAPRQHSRGGRMLCYFRSCCGAAAGQRYWGKGVCPSAPFLRAQPLNKREVLPPRVFPFHASVSTFLRREPVGICQGWHLAWLRGEAPGLPAACVVPGLPPLDFLDWGMSQAGQQTRSNPQKLACAPLVSRGWLAVCC